MFREIFIEDIVKSQDFFRKNYWKRILVRIKRRIEGIKNSDRGFNT